MDPVNSFTNISFILAVYEEKSIWAKGYLFIVHLQQLINCYYAMAVLS